MYIFILNYFSHVYVTKKKEQNYKHNITRKMYLKVLLVRLAIWYVRVLSLDAVGQEHMT